MIEPNVDESGGKTSSLVCKCVHTWSSGFTSVALTTMPRMCTSRPMDEAFTSRMGIDLESADALKIT